MSASAVETIRCIKAAELGNFADYAEYQTAQAVLKSGTVIVPIRAKNAGRMESFRIEFPKALITYLSSEKNSSASESNSGSGTDKKNVFAFIQPVRNELPEGFFESIRRFEKSAVEEFVRIRGSLEKECAYKRSLGAEDIYRNLTSIEAQSTDAKYPDSSLRVKFNVSKESKSDDPILLVATRTKVNGVYKSLPTCKNLKSGMYIRTVLNPAYFWFNTAGGIGLTWYVSEMKIYDESAPSVVTVFADDDETDIQALTQPIPPPAPALQIPEEEALAGYDSDAPPAKRLKIGDVSP